MPPTKASVAVARGEPQGPHALRNDDKRQNAATINLYKIGPASGMDISPAKNMKSGRIQLGLA